MATLKDFEKLVKYPAARGEGVMWEYLPVEPLDEDAIREMINNPEFDIREQYESGCWCGCVTKHSPEDLFGYGEIRLEALDFLRNEGFFEGKGDIVIAGFFNAAQRLHTENMEGQHLKIQALVRYVWEWLSESDPMLILNYRSQEGISILHSFFYNGTDKEEEYIVKFLDLWELHFPNKPLPEVPPGEDDDDDPQTIEYLLAYGVYPTHLARVLQRDAYTSEHLKWMVTIYDEELKTISTHKQLLRRKEQVKPEFKEDLDECIRLLHEYAGMPLDPV